MPVEAHGLYVGNEMKYEDGKDARPEQDSNLGLLSLEVTVLTPQIIYTNHEGYHWMGGVNKLLGNILKCRKV